MERGFERGRNPRESVPPVRPIFVSTLANVPELIPALRDPDGNLRRLAASALGKLAAPAAVEPLPQLLEHETGTQVRQYSIAALGRIGDPWAIDKLEQIDDDPAEKGYNRDAAQQAIGRIRGRQN